MYYKNWKEKGGLFMPLRGANIQLPLENLLKWNARRVDILISGNKLGQIN